MPPVSNIINNRKRAADQHGETISAKRTRKGNSHTAIDKMAASVSELATAFKNSGGETSPERRKAAIEMIENDDDLSENEQVQIFKVIRRDVAVADFIVGIRDKAKRTRYIQSELADL